MVAKLKSNCKGKQPTESWGQKVIPGSINSRYMKAYSLAFSAWAARSGMRRSRISVAASFRK